MLYAALHLTPKRDGDGLESLCHFCRRTDELRYFEARDLEHVHGTSVRTTDDLFSNAGRHQAVVQRVSAKRATGLRTRSVDVVRIDRLVIACWHDCWEADEPMLMPLLGIGNDDIACDREVAVLVPAAVVLDAGILVAASFED